MDGGAHGTVVASGLEFPEGPVWVDGVLYVTEIAGGAISRWTEAGGVERVAATGGGPNGAALGADGALYVTQNGGMFSDVSTTAGIQRVTLDGAVDMVVTEVAGILLEGPNDLAFGDDGRLWFTDPCGASDPALNDRPGRLFVVDLVSGDGELVHDVGPVFPNGIGFDADGVLLWTESWPRRLVRQVDGRPTTVVELPERNFPDGFAVGADGRLYVASTYGHCITVIDGNEVVERLQLGDGMPTNCCFGGTDLYVTESRHGTIWRFPLGVEGLPLRCA
ncbi:MAG: SMP-30/gluconolactonase/LRE family protein [Ilumatobacteraceae bacterium]